MSYFDMNSSLTFTLAGNLITQNIDLVDRTKFLKHAPQFIFVHGPWNLTHEHFDCILIRLFRLATDGRAPIFFGIAIHHYNCVSHVIVDHGVFCRRAVKQKMEEIILRDGGFTFVSFRTRLFFSPHFRIEM